MYGSFSLTGIEGVLHTFTNERLSRSLNGLGCEKLPLDRVADLFTRSFPSEKPHEDDLPARAARPEAPMGIVEPADSLAKPPYVRSSELTRDVPVTASR